MGLLETYQEWNFKPITPGASKTPRDQSDGKVAVDYLPNTYQKQIENRRPTDTVVIQASGDDATNGSFNTTTAFLYYSSLINGPLKNYKSRLVHKYNAQGTSDNDKYATSNEIRNTPGALYTTNS